MPRNGAGIYNLTSGQPVVTGTTISSTTFNTLTADIATALTTSIASDGQTTPSANLPMGGFHHTNVLDATARNQYCSAGQAQDNTFDWLSAISGTDTITATAPISMGAYAAGQVFRFVASGANTTTSVTLNINSLGAKSVTKNGSTALAIADIASGAVCQVTYDGTRFQLDNVKLNVGTSANNLVQLNGSAQLPAVDGSQLTGISSGKLQDFRLSLTSLTPVTTSDVTGATTIYCTPYKGNQIALYNGATWVTRTSAEFSLALGTLTASKPYDVFCYDNAGTPTLEFLAWTNDTTRATALAYQDGVLVKSGTPTRRYLGTFYTTATTTTEDSVANRYLWNYYSRVKRPMKRVESTASWNYTTATYRQANGSTSNQLNFVIGVNEDQVEASVAAMASNSSAQVYAGVSIGLDSTTTPAILSTPFQISNNGVAAGGTASYSGLVGIGRHYLSWLEISQTLGTCTWTGVNSPWQTGMVGGLMA